MTIYPTSDEVLAAPLPTYRPDALRVLRAWKREYRGRRRTEAGIAALLDALCQVYRTGVALEFRDEPDHYVPRRRLIVLDRRHLSVVTALHEFAHHRFGASELKAQRWAVHLFARVFPRTFARATFAGHRLVLDDQPTRAIWIREDQ